MLSCPWRFHDLCSMFFTFHSRPPAVHIGWVKQTVTMPPYALCFFISLPVSHLFAFSTGQHNSISYIHIDMNFIILAFYTSNIPWLFYSYRPTEQGCHPVYSCFHSSSPLPLYLNYDDFGSRTGGVTRARNFKFLAVPALIPTYQKGGEAFRSPALQAFLYTN